MQVMGRAPVQSDHFVQLVPRLCPGKQKVQLPLEDTFQPGKSAQGRAGHEVWPGEIPEDRVERPRGLPLAPSPEIPQHYTEPCKKEFVGSTASGWPLAELT